MNEEDARILGYGRRTALKISERNSRREAKARDVGTPPKSSQATTMRARIVPGCYAGVSNGVVAKKLHKQLRDGLYVAGTLSREPAARTAGSAPAGRAAINMR